jgi:hypothetical protein
MIDPGSKEFVGAADDGVVLDGLHQFSLGEPGLLGRLGR